MVVVIMDDMVLFYKLWFNNTGLGWRRIQLGDMYMPNKLEAGRVSTIDEFISLVMKAYMKRKPIFMYNWIYGKMDMVAFDRVHFELDFMYDLSEITNTAIEYIFWKIVDELNTVPFITRSGCHGIHVYIFVDANEVSQFKYKIEIRKLYSTIYEKLASLVKPFRVNPSQVWRHGLLPHRLPYSINTKCMSICRPVDYMGHDLDPSDAIRLLLRSLNTKLSLKEVIDNA